jgi:hypothetical protein
MAEPWSVGLFVEDRAHEHFLKPLIERIAREAGRPVVIRPYSVRGGHPRAREELRTFQQILEKGVLGLTDPDILVVGIDANCSPWHQARRGIAEGLSPRLKDRAALACPDPHIERWFLADPDGFQAALGRRPRLGRRKCERDLYKRLLADAVRAAGYPTVLGGIEFAEEIVAAMDLYRAGRREKSLKDFVERVRALLVR